MKKIFIIDEWLYHDLCGDNDENKQKETFELIKQIERRCDRILIVKNSPFHKKIFNKFAKKANYTYFTRVCFRFVLERIIFNSEKAIMCDEDLCEKDISNANKLFENIDSDDHYLIKAYLSLSASGKPCCIITTDQRLIGSIKNTECNIEILTREEFISNYMFS